MPTVLGAQIAAVALAFGVIHGAACASAMPAGRQDRRLPPGTWGGEHVALTVTDSGGHFEFDCAAGDIAKPLVVDDTGRFAMDGVFVQERPGAIRMGEQPERKPARYLGQLADKTLTFDVTLVDSKDAIGHFTVTLDATPRVRKCR